MRKVIVTGATGFIGKFLVRELIKQGIEVIAIIRKGSKNRNILENEAIRVIECDMHNYSYLPMLISDCDIDTVFHIAWDGVANENARSQDIQLHNLKATLDLIDVMNVMKIHTFVGCGSMHEAEALVEIAEDKVITNLGYMYKAAKTAAHWMGKAKAGSYGIRFFWPLINTYGEEEYSPRLINSVIRNIFNGVSPKLSNGTQYYDFVHVKDVAKALCLIAEKGIDGKNYMIGSGNAKPLKDFLIIVGNIANEMNGSNVPLLFGEIKNNVVSLPMDTFDIASLKKDTGFEISIDFESGVKETCEWIFQENKTKR